VLKTDLVNLHNVKKRTLCGLIQKIQKNLPVISVGLKWVIDSMDGGAIVQ
jgi:hypothetical protein